MGPGRGVRIGVDVGGTFTKAAMVDGGSGQLIAKAAVPTTHCAAAGVAEGVVRSFRQVLARATVLPSQVELVVLSTTQAVNALLEGDVTTVGVIGMSRAQEQREAARRTRLGPVHLSPEKVLPVHSTFLVTDNLDEGALEAAVLGLTERGARAVVASAAFGVEDPGPERRVLDIAGRLGIPATAGHEMSGLYGLEVRTLTATVNASILPRMAHTITHVEEGMRQAGLAAPLMVMQGDMEIAALEVARRRPASTILSGPAASVAGALLYHKLLDGLFMEVGGTSTNLGVVKGGRPATKYVRIMDHPTCLRSVDVRVAGVAGGSMVRLRGRALADIGPRSAHIAGLPYPSFCPPESLTGLRLVMVAPQPGDPEDYVAVESDLGARFAITLTDAANVLGLLPPGDYARGSEESARLALTPLAAHLGRPVEQAARRMLELAAQKLVPVLGDLAREYRLKRPELIGLGGGASVLVSSVAAPLSLPFRVVPHAEVISSIGVALAPVGVQVERSLLPDDPGALARWLREAELAAVCAGAQPETIRVTVEPIPERAAVRLRAVGAPVGTSASQAGALDAAAARSLAARALQLEPEALNLVMANGAYWVFQGERRTGVGPLRRRRQPLAVLDSEGVLRFRSADGVCLAGSADQITARLSELWRRRPGWSATPPRLVVICGGHLVDLPSNLAESLEPIARWLAPTPDSQPLLVLAGAG